MWWLSIGSSNTKLDETETEQKAKTALHDQNVSKQSVYFGVIIAFVFKYIKKKKGRKIKIAPFFQRWLKCFLHFGDGFFTTL